MATENMQSYIDKYADQITGITIDRGFGEGEEYFPIDNYTIDDNGHTILVMNDSMDYIDAKFLETCDYVQFHVSDNIVVKEDVKYILSFKQSEIESIVRLLCDIHDRLTETKYADSNIFTETVVQELPKKVWELKGLLELKAKGEK